MGSILTDAPALRPDGLPRFCPSGAVMQWIRTSVVVEHANPFTGCWPDLSRPLTMEEIDQCLAAGQEQLHPPFEWEVQELTPAQKRRRRQEHVQKIAWFVKHGFQQPLEVDVGIPMLRHHVRHKVLDGNHRLAAALYRRSRYGEDPMLPLSVGGDIEYAIELGLWVDDEYTLAERDAARAAA